MSRWRALGAVPPTTLIAAREMLHHAAQLLALAGGSYVEPRSDDSHTSMSWLDAHDALATLPIVARSPFRFALRASDLSLLTIADTSTEVMATLPLAGRTRGDALQWMRGECARAGLDADRLQSTLHFSIAPHPTDTGAPFVIPSDGTLRELAHWYADASILLGERHRIMKGAGPVRCWPHHFDMATLVQLPQLGRLETIGIGLSPGDDSYAEPYYYVAPSPRPAATPRALAVGAWHTTSWWGAVLPGSEIVARVDGGGQSAVVKRFIDDAVEQLLELPESREV